MGPARRLLALAIAAIATLTSPAFATTRHDERLAELAIEAGRLDAMMDGVSRALHVHATRDVQPMSAYKATTYISLSLRRAIRQYNGLMPIACRRHLIAGGQCGHRYEPVWLHSAFSDRDDEATWQARIEDASVPVEALWNSVCKRLSHTRRDVCEIE